MKWRNEAGREDEISQKFDEFVDCALRSIHIKGYASGVRDALGWVLGVFLEPPEPLER